MYGKDGDARAIDRQLASLVEGSKDRGVPPRVAEDARRITATRFSAVGRLSTSRIEAYFWGVVRRRALQGRAPAMRHRLILTSFADELTAAGHTPSRVYDELRRVYGGAVDPRLIEAYRPGSAHAA